VQDLAQTIQEQESTNLVDEDMRSTINDLTAEEEYADEEPHYVGI